MIITSNVWKSLEHKNKLGEKYAISLIRCKIVFSRLDIREFKSTIQSSVNSLDKFEQSSRDLVQTNLRFEQFRLEMIQQIAILKVRPFKY